MRDDPALTATSALVLMPSQVGTGGATAQRESASDGPHG